MYKVWTKRQNDQVWYDGYCHQAACSKSFKYVRIASLLLRTPYICKGFVCGSPSIRLGLCNFAEKGGGRACACLGAMTRQTRMAYLSEDVTNHAVKQFIICFSELPLLSAFLPRLLRFVYPSKMWMC